MKHFDYDVIVIGGGINGAATAREASMRGLSVLLLEKNDFGSGTSSWSSRLIHGGLRYLEYGELPLVYESLHDRRALLETAPHLVRPLRIAIPIFKESRRGKSLVRLGMIAYDLLSLGKELPAHGMMSARELIAHMPAINSEGLKGAALYYDGQVKFAERLVLENVLSAVEHGAVVRNYCEVDQIQHTAFAVSGVRYRNTRTGRSESHTASAVINAAGPWVDRVLDTADDDRLRRYMGGTKGSHIVMPRFDGAPGDAVYVEAKRDGRPIFIIPWNGQLLVGTTDIRVEEDPAEVRATPEEIAYLIEEVNRVFPAADLSPASISYSYSGVRPLPKQTDGPESAITRKHVIKHHNHVARGLYSIIGGKLTTFLSLAKDVVDRLNKDFDLGLPRSKTAQTAFPGAVGYAEIDAKLDRKLAGFDETTRRHLGDVYGIRAAGVLKTAKQNDALREVICTFSGAIAAEVVFAIRHEYARNIDDVLNRRTMIGLGPSRGLDALKSVAALMATELDWSDAERHEYESNYRQIVKDYTTNIKER